MSEDKNKPVNTVQNAMDYVNTPASSFSNWKVKDLGLQFLLFGIAELNAKRAIRLHGYISDLEDVIFDTDLVRTLQPKEVLGAYKLASETNRDILDFIAKTRKEMNWDAINSQLNEMAITDGENSSEADLRREANKLIEAMKSYKDDPDETEDDD